MLLRGEAVDFSEFVLQQGKKKKKTEPPQKPSSKLPLHEIEVKIF